MKSEKLRTSKCNVCKKEISGDYCERCSSFNVLDHGFARLVDFMGGDMAVVQAARVSYGQGSKGEDKDRRLIRFLMMHDHGTPFEMSVFKFHVKAPLFVARQWFRHRIGSFNEISGRYTVYNESLYYLPSKLRKQSRKNKQASEFAEFDNEKNLISLIQDTIENSFKVYNSLLDSGVARELARIVIPMAAYTEFYWGVNTRSLMNFLRLRIAPDAQWEIRKYAAAVWKFFSQKMPWTSDSFKEKYSDLKDWVKELDNGS